MYATGGNTNNLGINNNGTNTIKPLEGVSLIITLSVLCPIVLIVVFGNLLVIISIFVDRSLRKPQNMYFVSLAVVDLLVGVCIMPVSILHIINQTWILGKVMCKFYVTLDTTLCTMSFFHLVAIAVDRYRSINDGVQYIQRRTYKTVFIAIAGVFLVSVWISSPPILGWDKSWLELEEPLNSIRKCDILRSSGYAVYSAFGSLIFPMALMIYMYINIYYALRRKIRERASIKSLTHDRLSVSGNPVPGPGTARQSAIVNVEEETDTPPKKSAETSSSILPRNLSFKRLFRSENNETSKGNTKEDCSAVVVVRMSQEVRDFVASKQKFSLSQERNAARTLGMIMSGFLICWLPFCLVYVASPFLPEEFTPPYPVYLFVAWLGYLNSGLNPIIYTVFHKEFRNAFKQILCIT